MHEGDEVAEPVKECEAVKSEVQCWPQHLDLVSARIVLTRIDFAFSRVLYAGAADGEDLIFAGTSRYMICRCFAHGYQNLPVMSNKSSGLLSQSPSYTRFRKPICIDIHW